MNKRPLGFATEVDFIDVIDGDTILVEFKRKFAVRIIHPNDKNLEFNAPEKNTEDGIISKEELKKELAGKKLVIFIPANNHSNLMDIQSFNRILAEVWVDDELISQKMLDKGLAGLFKRGKY